MAEKLKNSVQIWHATIKSNIKKSSEGYQLYVRKIQDPRQPTRVDIIEAAVQHSVKLQVYTKIEECISEILGEIPNIARKNISQSVSEKCAFLRAITKADKLRISKDSMDPVFGYVNVKESKLTNKELFTYGKSSLQPSEIVEGAVQIQADIGDRTNSILKVLVTNAKYAQLAQDAIANCEEFNIARQPASPPMMVQPGYNQTPIQQPPNHPQYQPPHPRAHSPQAPKQNYGPQVPGYPMMPPPEYPQIPSNQGPSYPPGPPPGYPPVPSSPGYPPEQPAYPVPPERYVPPYMSGAGCFPEVAYPSGPNIPPEPKGPVLPEGSFGSGIDYPTNDIHNFMFPPPPT